VLGGESTVNGPKAVALVLGYCLAVFLFVLVIYLTIRFTA